MNLGWAIKWIRREAELTQKDAARKMEISTSALSQIENNHKFPTDKTLSKIAKALNVTPAYIYVRAIIFYDVPDSSQIDPVVFQNAKNIFMAILKP